MLIRKRITAVLSVICLVLTCYMTAFAANTDNTTQKGNTPMLQPLSDLPQIKIPQSGNQIADGIVILDKQNDMPDEKSYAEKLANFRKNANLTEFRDTVHDFTTVTAAASFETMREKNMIYSPLSAYAALCLLAECGDDSTNTDILTACGLNPETMTGLNVLHDLIYGLSFIENDQTLQLINSIWLDKPLLEQNGINQDTIDELCLNGNISAYAIPMGTNEASSQMRAWSEQATNGFLSISPATDPDTAAMLINALYFKDGWFVKFPESKTEPEALFTNSRNGTETVAMMHRSENGPYINAPQYQIAEIQSVHGTVRFLLPKENTDLYDLMTDANCISQLISPDLFHDSKQAHILWSVPRFNTDTEMNLSGLFQTIGLNTNTIKSTALLTEPVEISEIKQVSRIALDENGFEAAASTYAAMTATSANIDILPDIHMTLDRPFGFAIMSQDMPLFIACINTIE